MFHFYSHYLPAIEINVNLWYSISDLRRKNLWQCDAQIVTKEQCTDTMCPIQSDELHEDFVQIFIVPAYLLKGQQNVSNFAQNA